MKYKDITSGIPFQQALLKTRASGGGTSHHSQHLVGIWGLSRSLPDYISGLSDSSSSSARTT